MLWIEKYRPARFEEILSQDRVVDRLASFAEQGSVPHLLLFGGHGTGKSVAADCLSRALFGDRSVENTTVIPVADLFGLGKAYLESQERYAHLYRKDASLLSNFKNIVRWFASIPPLDARFRLLVLDGAEFLPREAQQGLRRIMERYSGTCRFVFCTTRVSAMIPALTSRCLPLFFGPVPDADACSFLGCIASREFPPDAMPPAEDLDLIVTAARGDLRKGILLLQALRLAGGRFDPARFLQSEVSGTADAAVRAMKVRDGESARKAIEGLLLDHGLSAGEVVREIREAVRREYNDPRIAAFIGDAEFRLGHGNSEYIHIHALAARIIAEVFS